MASGNADGVPTDDETTDIQFAIDANDVGEVRRLIAPHSVAELSSLQFYGTSTMFMYACERSTPEMVKLLLQKRIKPFELEYSDNNELKAALANKQHRNEILPLVLSMLPKDLTIEMITSDWDPDDQPQGQAKSAFQIASKFRDTTCKKLLLETLERLKAT